MLEASFLSGFTKKLFDGISLSIKMLIIVFTLSALTACSDFLDDDDDEDEISDVFGDSSNDLEGLWDVSEADHSYYMDIDVLQGGDLELSIYSRFPVEDGEGEYCRSTLTIDMEFIDDGEYQSDDGGDIVFISVDDNMLQFTNEIGETGFYERASSRVLSECVSELENFISLGGDADDTSGDGYIGIISDVSSDASRDASSSQFASRLSPFNHFVVSMSNKMSVVLSYVIETIYSIAFETEIVTEQVSS